MAQQFRRVVTGHDPTGRAIVKIDEIAKNLVSSRPGATSCVVWTTEGFPADNTGEEDEGLRKTGTTLDNGTVFRILELAPGVQPAQPSHGFDRLRGGDVRRGRHGARRYNRPSQGRRRAGAARHDPTIGSIAAPRPV